MAISNNDAISTLNNLIETCRDGQNGFQSAAEGITDSSIKSLFEQYSQQRAQFVGELQNEVRRLGGDPQNTGSVAAALHRGWINIKSAVTGKDEHNILEEAERGEDSAVRNYEDALNQNLPPEVLSIVQRQFAAVREAHNRVRSLRDRTRTARI
ncbi:MAG: PA2169 family four-helix-bundle protein [Blastocatellia bacterium]